MLLQKVLGLKGDAYLIEGSFEGIEMNLKTLEYLDRLGMLPEGSVEKAVSIRDKDGAALGVALKNKHPDGDFWMVIPYPASRAMGQRTEKLVNAIIDGGIVASVKNKKVDSGPFRAALREYLAVSLAEKALCDCDKEREPGSFAYNEERKRHIGALLERLAGEHGLRLKGMDALEICCGNGMSTAALAPLFKSVLSVDNDKCAACNGVYRGVLAPERVMVVDARELTKHVDEKYDAVLGFMLGTIYEFNKNLWRRIFEESIKALKDDGFILLTVNGKEEMEFLAGAYKALGVPGRVMDNADKKSIYDACVFFALKKNGKFCE